MFVELTGGRRMHDTALAEHQDAVGEAEHLGDLAGDQQHGQAFVGQSPDDRVQLGAGAHVDAPGGFVEQQDPAAAQQPAGQDRFLLVAAGQGADRHGGVVGPQRQLAGRRPGRAEFGAPVDPKPAREKRDMEETETLRVTDSSISRACALRSSGASPIPARTAARTLPGFNALPSTTTWPVVGFRAP